MAKPQATRAVNAPAARTRASTDEKVATALKQASRHARKQLSLQGLKLPTQTWARAAVRNPAV